jgi:lipid-binding SYLF domain-containing protein
MQAGLKIGFWLIYLIGMVLVSGCATPGKSDVDKRAEVRAMASDTLARLYAEQPSARTAVERAAGYGAFSNFGLKILVAGGGSGSGLIVDNSSGQETFMKVLEVQAGLGAGIKKYQLVLVFETEQALRDFIDSGWQFGGQATASVQMDGSGTGLTGAVAVAPGIWVYQLTDDGIALELTLKGTRFYRDEQLN